MKPERLTVDGVLISIDAMDFIIDSISIVDYINEITQLAPKDSIWFGHCPFCDKEESVLTVSDMQQSFYCYTCYNGGNIIKFVMLHKDYTFPQAVKELAESLGLEDPITH